LWRAFSSSCSGRRPMSIISSVDCFLLHEHMHHQLSSSSLSILRKSRNKGFNKCAITCDRLCYIVSHEEQNQPHIPAARRVFLLLFFAKCPVYYPMLGGRFVTKSFCADLIVWWERESRSSRRRMYHQTDGYACIAKQACRLRESIDHVKGRSVRTGVTMRVTAFAGGGTGESNGGWGRRRAVGLSAAVTINAVLSRRLHVSFPQNELLLPSYSYASPFISSPEFKKKASASGRWYTRQSCYSTLSHLDCPPYVAVSVSPCVLCGTRVIRKYNLNSSPQRHQAICYNSTQVTPHCHQACITICPCHATFIFI
jgi:hypothetical protein